MSLTSMLVYRHAYFIGCFVIYFLRLLIDYATLAARHWRHATADIYAIINFWILITLSRLHTSLTRCHLMPAALIAIIDVASLFSAMPLLDTLMLYRWVTLMLLLYVADDTPLPYCWYWSLLFSLSLFHAATGSDAAFDAGHRCHAAVTRHWLHYHFVITPRFSLRLRFLLHLSSVTPSRWLMDAAGWLAGYDDIATTSFVIDDLRHWLPFASSWECRRLSEWCHFWWLFSIIGFIIAWMLLSSLLPPVCHGRCLGCSPPLLITSIFHAAITADAPPCRIYAVDAITPLRPLMISCATPLSIAAMPLAPCFLQILIVYADADCRWWWLSLWWWNGIDWGSVK